MSKHDSVMCKCYRKCIIYIIYCNRFNSGLRTCWQKFAILIHQNIRPTFLVKQIKASSHIFITKEFDHETIRWQTYITRKHRIVFTYEVFSFSKDRLIQYKVVCFALRKFILYCM